MSIVYEVEIGRFSTEKFVNAMARCSFCIMVTEGNNTRDGGIQ
jgi:hypothetical protein